AEAATTTTVDEKEPEPAIKAATAQVTIDPATETATEQVITEPTKTEAKPKPYPRPLSPYASVMFIHSPEPAAKAATEQVITKAKPKSYSRPLSPYASVNLQTKATNYKETRKIVKPQLGLHLV
ncbi:unnamed protein product, partial [Brassica oleracea]